MSRKQDGKQRTPQQFPLTTAITDCVQSKSLNLQLCVFCALMDSSSQLWQWQIAPSTGCTERTLLKINVLRWNKDNVPLGHDQEPQILCRSSWNRPDTNRHQSTHLTAWSEHNTKLLYSIVPLDSSTALVSTWLTQINISGVMHQLFYMVTWVI